MDIPIPKYDWNTIDTEVTVWVYIDTRFEEGGKGGWDGEWSITMGVYKFSYNSYLINNGKRLFSFYKIS